MKKDITIKIETLLLKGILENPEAKKLVILVHGFTGDLQGPENIFEKLSEKLQQFNYAVLRFNFRGTPPSEGDFIDMTLDTEAEDLRQIIRYAKSLGYSEIGLLGESMGGAVAVEAYEKSLKIIVFWYPVFDFSDSGFEVFLTKEAQKKLIKQGFIKEAGFKVGKKFIEEILRINLFDKVKEIKCPVLFLHGDKDSDVPCRQSKKAFEIAKEPKEIQIIKGADHCFKNEQTEVIDLTTNFLQRFF